MADTAAVTVPKDSATRSRWRDAALVVAGLTIAGGGSLVATYFRDSHSHSGNRTVRCRPGAWDEVSRSGDSRGDQRLAGWPLRRVPCAAARAATDIVAAGTRQPGVPRTARNRSAAVCRSGLPTADPSGSYPPGSSRRPTLPTDSVHTVAAVSNPAGASWSPDGVILLGNATGGLWRVPALGGQPVALTALDSTLKETGHVNPHFLPDGKRFLYTALPDNVVFLASLDSADRIKVIDGAANAQFAPPGYLLFLQAGLLACAAIRSIPRRRQRRRGSGGRASPHGARQPVWIVFDLRERVCSRTSRRLATRAVNLSGSIERGVDLGPATANLSDARFPRLSPDGRRLALIRRGDIWIEDLQGRPSIRLTSDGAQIRSIQSAMES